MNHQRLAERRSFSQAEEEDNGEYVEYIEAPEVDDGEYVEYIEAPVFHVVDVEYYYGEVNMESVAEENPWADMVEEVSVHDAVYDCSYEVALREARGRVLRKMCDGWGECLACSLKSKKTRYGQPADHFLTLSKLGEGAKHSLK